MSIPSDTTPPRVLAAALTLFGRHGFQRTSMADVAREARIARATLYLRYPDKRALFGALASWLVDEALTRAQAAWNPSAALSANIAATLLAKELIFFHIINATPHGAEIMELDAELTAAHLGRLYDDFAALLAKRGSEAVRAGADLTAFGGEEGFASFLATAGSSLKHATRTEEAFRAAIERLARVSASAAGQA